MTALNHSSERRLCLLSNGAYTVMLGDNGAGFSRWRDLAVTRWREDPTGDPWGTFLLLRDEPSGMPWSATQQPYGIAHAGATAELGPGRATFYRRQDDLSGTLEIAVAHDADIELRRLTLTNHGEHPRTFSVTCYSELVLGSAAADATHPAFSKMFVQTEWDPQRELLLATRRRRAESEPEVWSAHALQVEAAPNDDRLEYETDRARFLGRCRNLRDAQAMQPRAALSNTAGCVLDPIVSLRRQLTLAPGATVRVSLWTHVTHSRAGAQSLRARIDDSSAADNLFAGAERHALAEQSRLSLDAAQSALFARWLKALLISEPGLRPCPEILVRGSGGPATLWPAGISGDRPIVLLRLDTNSALISVQELMRAQNYWRGQRLGVDVVLLNAARGPDADALQSTLSPLVEAQRAQLQAGETAQCEMFLLREESSSEALCNGLMTAARIVLDICGARKSDAANSQRSIVRPATATPIRSSAPIAAMPNAASTALEFVNGDSGFGANGREYQINLDNGHTTPAPWVNVIANPYFGCLLSAEGGGYSWSLNSQQNPLTPWPNDPVSDTPHEIVYLRDRVSGALWSAAAMPIRIPDAKYVSTHGKGWSRLTSRVQGIETQLTVCVPTVDPVKLTRVRIINRSDCTRHLSVTGYVEWALGGNGTTPAPYIITSRDDATGALLARNPWRSNFGQRIAFADLGGAQHSMSGDRGDFLGPLGAVDAPAALSRNAHLSGRLGAGLDACAALQTHIELLAGTQIDLLFLLGDAVSHEQARELIEKYRTIDLETVLADIAAQWSQVLDAVQVRTPDRAMDIMLNDWLLYQVLGCRVWARTAYYQASGAYGFRDQLQDVMALCVSRPDLAREHLLRAAGRQFVEGDVQHWWLPPGGQGVRTKISDARVWLVYVAMHYVGVTGDRAVLEEVVPFLDGQHIPDGASDVFFQPTQSDQKVSVYEHCALALDSSLTTGAHGLPLIGTGDWNDGMNAVGEQGRGESTWLGWFLLSAISALAPCAQVRGENERARHWLDYGARLHDALQQAWDGQWYRRGYFDDGAPLGSHSSDECQIDSIAQSWSVICGAAPPLRAAQAMSSVDELLIDYPNRIARLFTPPFDHSVENPGYIKGYPPGVRENGGQYTHAATWTVFAWAGLGDGDRAGASFDLLNPIHHGDSTLRAQRYKVEPYVVAADIYSVAPHVGRGGWTWYTGSAAWLYRAGLEAVLGFRLCGDRLRIDPCIPKSWPGFELTYRRPGPQGQMTRYEITIQNPRSVCRGVSAVDLDGQTLPPYDAIPLTDDGQTHSLHIVLG